jgi:hypothetical protein
MQMENGCFQGRNPLGSSVGCSMFPALSFAGLTPIDQTTPADGPGIALLCGTANYFETKGNPIEGRCCKMTV